MRETIICTSAVWAFMGLLDSKPVAAIEETTRLIPQASRLDSAPAMSRLAMSSHLEIREWIFSRSTRQGARRASGSTACFPHRGCFDRKE
jgi:hypothetical protein